MKFPFHDVPHSELVIVDDRLYVIGGQEGDFMAKLGSMTTTTLNPFVHVAAPDNIKSSSSIGGVTKGKRRKKKPL